MRWWYIGGGAGMAPLRSHIFELFRNLKTGRKVSYWYGGRSLRELFYVDHFREIEKELSELQGSISHCLMRCRKTIGTATPDLFTTSCTTIFERSSGARGCRILLLWSADDETNVFTRCYWTSVSKRIISHSTISVARNSQTPGGIAGRFFCAVVNSMSPNSLKLNQCSGRMMTFVICLLIVSGGRLAAEEKFTGNTMGRFDTT